MWQLAAKNICLQSLMLGFINDFAFIVEFKQAYEFVAVFCYVCLLRLTILSSCLLSEKTDYFPRISLLTRLCRLWRGYHTIRIRREMRCRLVVTPNARGIATCLSTDITRFVIQSRYGEACYEADRNTAITLDIEWLLCCSYELWVMPCVADMDSASGDHWPSVAAVLLNAF